MATTADFIVEGMTCDHCVRAVRAEVSTVPTVTRVDLDLGTGALVVSSDLPVDDDAVRAAVEEAGYRVVDG
ncbi:heavy-metal-associated domain-containing protein [soil metagenome]